MEQDRAPAFGPGYGPASLRFCCLACAAPLMCLIAEIYLGSSLFDKFIF